VIIVLRITIDFIFGPDVINPIGFPLPNPIRSKS
jgi:hypothetical protein